MKNNNQWCLPEFAGYKQYQRDCEDIGAKAPWDKKLAYKIALHFYLNRATEQAFGLNRCQTGATVCGLELALLERGNPIVFVDSPALVHFLLDSTYSDDLCASFNTEPARYFAFPKMQIDEIDLGCAIFGVWDAYGLDRFHLVVPGDRNNGFAFTAKNEAAFPNYSRSAIYNTEQTRWDIKTPAGADVAPVNIANRRALHLKLCAATLVYMKAFPDYVRDGFPEFVKKTKCIHSKVITAAPEILEGATRTSVSMHIRAGHFRTYRADKYKRNDDGTFKVGFVRQALIAGKLTPRTAVTA